MPNPIPSFDHNLVIPPHLGDPRLPAHLSPYFCTIVDICEKLASTPQRVDILKKFIAFREKLDNLGLKNGYQWLDGSFLEDIENQEGRSPRDLDVVTVYWGYDISFQENLVKNLPEFFHPALAKHTYSLDHYPFDASHLPEVTVEISRYWIQLFSHNRNSVWKGMLKVALDTPEEDAIALKNLQKSAT